MSPRKILIGLFDMDGETVQSLAESDYSVLDDSWKHRYIFAEMPRNMAYFEVQRASHEIQFRCAVYW